MKVEEITAFVVRFAERTSFDDRPVMIQVVVISE